MIAPFELLPHLLRGALVTLEVTAVSAALAFFLSFAAAFARTSPSRAVRIPATLYVESFRGTSALVQLFYVFYILPVLGVTLPALATGVLVLSFNTAAYGSEIVRAAIASIDKGQREAAAALGLRKSQIMRLVVIPQALVLIWPAFGNLLVELVKSSSLVSLITLTDLTFSAVQLVIATGRSFETWALVLGIYFAIAYPLSVLAGAAERRMRQFRAGAWQERAHV
jgi:polar amino acid transport system permease protein